MSYIQVVDDDVADKIIGVMWNTASSSPTLQQIDVDGDVITKKSTAWFDRHPVWGGMKRCLLSVDGVPTYGSNARGDGLDLTGASGQVMAARPGFHAKARKDGDYLLYWSSPGAYPGFVKHPWFYQRGGIERGVAYVGAYLASLRLNAAGSKYLLSATGKQPVSGGEIVELTFTGGLVQPVESDVLTGATSGVQGTVISVYKVSGAWGVDAAGTILLKIVDEKITFSSGTVAFTVGQLVTGASSGATGTIVAVVVTSGSFEDDNAAGYLVIRGGNGLNFTSGNLITDPLGGSATVTSDGGVKANFTNPENLQISGSTVAVSSSAGSALSLTRQLAETYGNNVGSSRWGIEDIWGIDARTMLYLIEYCSWQSQSLTAGIGQGVVNKPWTRRFGGENAGAGSADSNIAENGTGRGIGTDGLVHVVYRGEEDPFGNLYRFGIGLDVLDANYRILKPTGVGTPACPMASGSYVESITAPHTHDPSLRPDGYATGILFEDATKFLFLPNKTGGSSITSMCDWASLHRAGQTNILLVGGSWGGGANCGVGYRAATNVASLSSRYSGCRLEFV
jgi:hypothetical protein